MKPMTVDNSRVIREGCDLMTTAWTAGKTANASILESMSGFVHVQGSG